MTDPTHPLYGRIFEWVWPPGARDPEGWLLVRYRDGIVLRVPRRATSLLLFGHDIPRATLSRAAVEDLLSLVKEYESCPAKSLPAKSGTPLRPKTGKKSSRN